MSIKELASSFTFCKRCAGRLVGTKGISQPDAYQLVLEKLPDEIEKSIVNHELCQLCQGTTSEILAKVPSLLKTLQQFEFESFLVGCHLTPALKAIDERVQKQLPLATSLKQEIRAEVGKRVQLQLDKDVDFSDPDISIILDVTNLRYNLQIKSLYILGRYNKLVRGIPQTKWPCSNCKGRKCSLCNYTGQQYTESVESLVSAPFKDACKSKHASFHGAGREDIDALMLGDGRPFVLELKKPMVRTLDLSSLMEVVNKSQKVFIRDLRITDKSTVAYIKQSSPDSKKTYRALVTVDGMLDNSHITTIKQQFSQPVSIEQRTPTRVSHRRADKVRTKSIYQVDIPRYSTRQMELEIKAQGGAYIKEFISGDDGRTSPSIASCIGRPTKCVELDVLKVDDHGLFDQSTG